MSVHHRTAEQSSNLIMLFIWYAECQIYQADVIQSDSVHYNPQATPSHPAGQLVLNMAANGTIVNGDAEAFINDPGRGFLGNLTPSVIPHYAYRGREQFLCDYNAFSEQYNNPPNCADQWFIVTGVNTGIFDSNFRDAETGPFSQWCSYDTALELLLVKMPESTTHSIASRTFDQILLEALEPLRMGRALTCIGSGCHFGDMGGKEPDEAWRPIRLPPGRTRAWPSVVLEVALSETQAKLRSDVRYWLRASEGDVKSVLTLSIDRGARRIVIRKWATNANGRQYEQQNVVISRAANGRVSITGAPLIISFEELFLRSPTVPRERNIEINDEMLEFIAAQTWEEQEET